MNLTTATPVEIDTQLAEIYGRYYKVVDQAQAVEAAILRYTTFTDRNHRNYAGEYLAARYRDELARQTIKRDELRSQAQEISAETDPLEAEFRRRGGWNRAFLVNNTNGHVHNTTACSSCFATTRFVWLPEYSGADESKIVEDAGEIACTVCYPSAPVDVLQRKTKIEAPERRAARLEREAAKAARAAKKLEKAILPTGEALAITRHGYTDKVETLAAARSRLADEFESWTTPEQSVVEVLAEAIANKESKTVETVIEEAKKRAAKRR